MQNTATRRLLARDPAGQGSDHDGGPHDDVLLSLMRVGDRTARSRHDVRAGERALVGSCRCHECAVDVLVTATAAHWCLAEVTGERSTWQLTNLSVDTDLWVVDMEDERQRVRLAPGRVGVVVPFEFSRLHFRHAGRQVSDSVIAIGPEQVFVCRPHACHQSYRPVAEAMLTPGTTYMAVVEELCSSTDGGAPPTSSEIAARLSSGGRVVTRRAVDHHIDYVYRRLFPSARTAPRSPGWKRLAVASMLTRAALLGVDVFAGRPPGQGGVKGEDPAGVPGDVRVVPRQVRGVHSVEPDSGQEKEKHPT